MIRKLKSGSYRLYSRRKIRKRASDEISSPSRRERRRRSTRKQSSISSVAESLFAKSAKSDCRAGIPACRMGERGTGFQELEALPNSSLGTKEVSRPAAPQ